MWYSLHFIYLFIAEEKKRERKKNKKRVKFAEKVMVKEVERISGGKNIEEQGMENRVVSSSECRNEIAENREMPANRIALYNGILRDRGYRMACCH